MLTGQLVLFKGINRFNNHPGLFGISYLFLRTGSRLRRDDLRIFCGPDGTRTRDLRRDRAAF